MQQAQTVDVFSALANGTRLKLLQYLDEKELTCEDPENCRIDERCCDVSELAEHLGITSPSVSHHLKELRRAGLVSTEKRGRHVYCSLNRNTMHELSAFFDSLTRGGNNTC